MEKPGAAALRALLERCRTEPGYTPPQRDLPLLLERLAQSSEAGADPLERALARAGAATLQALAAALPGAGAEQRPRLLALAARLAGGSSEPESRARLSELLVAELGAAEPASRKWAARGLAKLGDAGSEPALLRALEAAPAQERKSLVDALASAGGAASVPVLRALAANDADLARRQQRALALIERRLGHDEEAEVRLDRPLGEPWRVLLRCRAGLGELLRAELAALGLHGALLTAGVELRHPGALAELLEARITLDVGLRLELDPAIAEPSECLAAALAAERTLAALEAWTQGVPRLRVAWTDAGHQRARAWALAHALRARTARVVNDPRGALWTLRARADASGEAWLVPRLEPDPRFRYRVQDVPAASHPTLAAALARAAGVQADEVVWDPFVGSGLELIERARLAPVRALVGSDVDPRALAAARANLDSAGVAAELLHGSALELAPEGVSLILTNPPMGRRVARDGKLGELLERFVRHAARVLRPGGRLVWLSPLAERTERAARASGLSVSNGPDVDLGGFAARLQSASRGG